MVKRGSFLRALLKKDLGEKRNLGKKNKKAQFYLIAAIIIMAVIIGMGSITNYIITKKEPVKFYDLSQELDEEGARVVEHGVYKEKDIPTLIEDFTDNYVVKYAEEKEKGSELVFVYGNRDNVTVSTYISEKTGEVVINYGSTEFIHSGTDKYIANIKSFIPEVSEEEEYTIVVKVLGVEYIFNLKEGENFFFVISKKTEEETYIVGST